MLSTDFDPAFATATATANAIRCRRISACELLQLTFDRIDRQNPRLNAIVWQDRERALARARDADAAIAKKAAPGPFHGVPITIKESIAYRGSPNTWGLPHLQPAISPRTAAVVERLESSGAIVVGKTNVPVMLGDWQTDNPVYGRTNNPWDLARTPGGSTGGGAAAVAAGLGSMTIGSDLAGSIRIPAHFCGVYGHKPSLNLVDMSGFLPGPWDGSPGYPMDLAVAGPLARSARDLALALEVLGGPNVDDARAWTWRMPPPRHTRLEDFRIGWVLDDATAPVASDIRSVYEGVISGLRKAGATLLPGWPSGLDLRAHLPTFQYLLLSLVNAEKTVDAHARWLRETQNRLALRARWQQYFEGHDVFLLPVTFTSAFPHDRTQPMENRFVETPDGKQPYLDMAAWISAATVAGLPATVVPVGRTNAGLPVGMQIVAPMWEDATAIEFGALLSDITGGFSAPPELTE